jgi:hypothetical protein
LVLDEGQVITHKGEKGEKSGEGKEEKPGGWEIGGLVDREAGRLGAAALLDEPGDEAGG